MGKGEVKNLLEKGLEELEELSQSHLQKFMALLNAGNAKMYSLDLLSVAIYKRSMSHISGFCTLIRNNNFTCAVPIIRMQLDNALRFYATTLVKDPNKLVSEFINGAHIANFKDLDTGKNLSDTYLVKKLGKQFPGLLQVYRDTSGFVHLSEKHLFSAMGKKEEENMQVSISVGSDDSFITDHQRVDAVNSMIDVTKIVLWTLSGWTAHKDAIPSKIKLN